MGVINKKKSLIIIYPSTINIKTHTIEIFIFMKVVEIVKICSQCGIFREIDYIGLTTALPFLQKKAFFEIIVIISNRHTFPSQATII